MADINELLVMRWLFENTKEPNCNIPWQRKESGGYFAILYEGKEYQVTIAIARVQSRPTAVIVVQFSSPGKGEVFIQEPIPNVFQLFLLRKGYDSEDDEELVKIMNNLLTTVASQLAQKTLHDMETEKERKQAIFHRLLFGNSKNE